MGESARGGYPEASQLSTCTRNRSQGGKTHTEASTAASYQPQSAVRQARPVRQHVSLTPWKLRGKQERPRVPTGKRRTAVQTNPHRSELLSYWPGSGRKDMLEERIKEKVEGKGKDRSICSPPQSHRGAYVEGRPRSQPLQTQDEDVSPARTGR